MKKVFFFPTSSFQTLSNCSYSFVFYENCLICQGFEVVEEEKVEIDDEEEN